MTSPPACSISLNTRTSSTIYKLQIEKRGMTGAENRCFELLDVKSSQYMWIPLRLKFIII
jgi:hypothetical protein